jgi:hypothetical protein
MGLDLEQWDDEDLLIACCHEAGHAVVGQVVGHEVEEIWVGPGAGGVSSLADPLPPPTVSERVWPTRKELMMNVAGCLAHDMAHELFWSRKWLDDAEIDAMIAGDDGAVGLIRPYRVSTVLLHQPSGYPEGSDPDNARNRAREVCAFRSLLAARRPDGTSPPPMPVTEADILAEVRHAERRARAVLRHHWGAVTKLAHSLNRRRPRRMTGGQVRRLIGDLR